MTSNIGTKHLVNRSRMGFGGSKEISSAKELEDMVLKELKKDFPPEFINRIDETIVFHPLGRAELARICRLLVDDVNTTIAPKGASVDVDDAAIEWLLRQSGDDPNMGEGVAPGDSETCRGPGLGNPDRVEGRNASRRSKVRVGPQG
jgi:ATP-dependent Clp protease ATP-binding subunit ClpC